MTTRSVSVLLLANLLLASPVSAADAPAGPEAVPAVPLVLLGPEPWPDPFTFAVDALLPAAASAAVLVGGPRLLGASLSDNQFVALGWIAGVATLPPAALVGYRTRPFALDSYMAGFSGGMVGLGLGVIGSYAAGWLSREVLAVGASPSAGLPFALAAIALGQGIGSASGMHLYRVYRPILTDLDRLPEKRTDDPIDNWLFWKERRNP